jgi:CheY-like chemotaxis protein/anti-sigma regulatory factor (Ser/Thr protein kinase)
VEIRPERIPVSRLVNGLKQTFQPIANDKKVEFVVEVAPEAPSELETDSQRLEQVLKNLLSNAFKFTEEGEVRLAIRKAGDNKVALSVTDTGIGIGEEQQQSIFEAFQQADGTISRKYGGTGLGLSISRELLRLLGGTIHLKSKPGQGSQFTVTIPVTYDAARVEPRTPSRAVTAATPVPIKHEPLAPPRPRSSKVDDDRDQLSDAKHVLLVIEDDDAFASILRDLSREMGFRALVAGTAEEALALAKQHKPSAVVLDVGLPDQSGLSVLDRLKRDVRTRHIPIHIISMALSEIAAYLQKA